MKNFKLPHLFFDLTTSLIRCVIIFSEAKWGRGKINEDKIKRVLQFLYFRMHNCTLWILLFITVGIICDEQHSIAIEEAVESSFAGLTFGTNSYFSKFMRKRSASEPIRKNRCELKLVADYEFFRAIGNNNYANAARYLVFSCLICVN